MNINEKNINENNTLKEEIREIIRLCNKAVEEHGEKASFFEEPASEEEMNEWEKNNNAKIPESYKEWLRFTRKCRIVSTVARFWGPSEFHSKYIPDDLVAIGEVIGDGEMICFSKTTGIIQNLYGYPEEKYESFKDVLLSIIEVLDDKKINWTDEEIAEMVARFEEIKAERSSK